uniref:Tetratricopeptide repeat protein 1 n=1 Tax=Anthurium amnicola TaxID=1678845 RepID=A0A1D1YNZ0_9ARAE
MKMMERQKKERRRTTEKRKKRKNSNSNSNSAALDAHPNPHPHPHPAPPSVAATRLPSYPAPNGAADLDASVLLSRAHELKEEGNRRFQALDYGGALERYDVALKLLPPCHPDRAVFHSNRAACLMQMRPVDHEAVASECTLALLAQPRFPRALLRRARALEALGRPGPALHDVQALLAADPSHQDALDLARRLRAAGGPRQVQEAAQQDLQSRPSPAALGASAVRGAPICGLGPCLPARPVPKKSSPAPQPGTAAGKSEKLLPQPLSLSDTPWAVPNGPEFELLTPKSDFELSKVYPSDPSGASAPTKPVVPRKTCSGSSSAAVVARWRPLKLVYDHDIRLAQMPENCNFRVLREIVSKRFPSSKSVLIKYKDADGDLVTVTSTDELRLAESCVNQIASKESDTASETEKRAGLPMLRLHIVEVCAEQEPPLPEEEEEKPVEDEGLEQPEDSLSQSLAEDTVVENGSDGVAVVENVDNSIEDTVVKEEVPKEKARHKECNHAECKEVEIDDWLFEFAQLFRTQVGIDPDAHLDLHELGMELCSEALEETVTSEEAQELFEMAASKFQEVAALAFFNWGNVHMCAARKRIPLDNSASREVVTAGLQAAYDWVLDRYVLAGQKYEEALRIKPDFYEGLLALGQQHFETAKLQWSFALANKIDLASWDSSETIQLFNSAEEKMKAASMMWEKLEEQKAIALKDPSTTKRDELLKRRKKPGLGTDDLNGEAELTADESAEQTAIMKSQIHLFWGNMLFERSQVEFKLGQSGDWKKNLDAAVERFKLAGASEADISVVLKNHSSNGDGVEDEKRLTYLSSTTSL